MGQILEKHRNIGKKLYSSYIDFEAAFNRVSGEVVCNKIALRQPPDIYLDSLGSSKYFG